MRKSGFRFVSDESGTTLIEYALIASLIAIVLITATSQIGLSSKLSGTFAVVAGRL